MSRKGGKAIASGSYGCVFRPALNCRGVSSDKRQRGVSKLMQIEDATEEMDEMEPILKKVKTLPNSSKFFAVSDINMCTPAALTVGDKVDFNKKCSSFVNDGIDSFSVNQQLNDLSIINMPDLGMDLHDYIGAHEPFNVEQFQKFNKMMINLLVGGVVPMNESGVLHHDLKDTNIMIDADGNTIIIDWGFSGISTPASPIPENVMSRPVQFNTPFSAMLINEAFVKEYTRVCKSVKKQHFTNMQNKSFIKQYYDYHVRRNPGHETYMIQTIRDISNDNSFIQMFMTYNAEILETFTTDCKFDMEKYFTQVYRFNVDIWGACTTFLQFIKTPELLRGLPAPLKKKATDIYYDILFNICFVDGSKRIDVNRIVSELTKLTVGDIGPAAVAATKQKSVLLKSPKTSPRGKDSGRGEWSSTSAIKQTSSEHKKRCPKGYSRHTNTKKCTLTLGSKKGEVVDTPPPPPHIPSQALRSFISSSRRKSSTRRSSSSAKRKSSARKSSSARKKSSTRKKSPTRKHYKRCPKGYHRHPKTKKCTSMSGPNKGSVIATP